MRCSIHSLCSPVHVVCRSEQEILRKVHEEGHATGLSANAPLVQSVAREHGRCLSLRRRGGDRRSGAVAKTSSPRAQNGQERRQIFAEVGRNRRKHDYFPSRIERQRNVNAPARCKLVTVLWSGVFRKNSLRTAQLVWAFRSGALKERWWPAVVIEMPNSGASSAVVVALNKTNDLFCVRLTYP